MDRKQLKVQAKGLIRTADPKPIIETLILLAISIIISWFIGEINGDRYSYLYSALQSGDMDQYYYALEYAMPTPLETLFLSVLQLVSLIISAGFIIFALRTVDGSGASYLNILDGFGMFFRIIWLYTLEYVFIFLWSLLLFFPGIIAFYRYRMAIYLLLEHPEMSALQCISESKRIMKGHKGELFGVDLSFIGWAFLVGVVDYIGLELGIPFISLGILVQIYLMPYYHLTLAGYYKQLTAPAADPDPFNGWTPEL